MELEVKPDHLGPGDVLRVQRLCLCFATILTPPFHQERGIWETALTFSTSSTTEKVVKKPGPRHLDALAC